MGGRNEHKHTNPADRITSNFLITKINTDKCKDYELDCKKPRFICFCLTSNP